MIRITNEELPPCAESGRWKIDLLEVTPKMASFAQLRAGIGHPLEHIVPGTYKRLMRGRNVVMSNTPMEMMTNTAFIKQARGRIFINGLGLGVVLAAILKKPDIKSVTVVEKSPDVIKLTAPFFQRKDGRLLIIQGDALEYEPVVRYDVVWHDIWDNICTDNLAQMKQLRAKFARRCRWQGCWSQKEMRE